MSFFSPKQYPWYVDVPVEPATPTEPTRDSEFLYSEMDEEDARNGGLENDMGASDDETVEVMFKDSLEYIDSDEERRLEDLVDAEYAKLYDMRNSNRFFLDNTQANVDVPRDSVARRLSLRVRHKDLGLDGHTQAVKAAGNRAYDS